MRRWASGRAALSAGELSRALGGERPALRFKELAGCDPQARLIEAPLLRQAFIDDEALARLARSCRGALAHPCSLTVRPWPKISAESLARAGFFQSALGAVACIEHEGAVLSLTLHADAAQAMGASKARLRKWGFARVAWEEDIAQRAWERAREGLFHDRHNLVMEVSVPEGLRADHREALLSLREIAPGRGLSARELAEQLKRPELTRAIARAGASNELALMLPCHRLLGARALGPSAWGEHAKRWLILGEALQARQWR